MKDRFSIVLLMENPNNIEKVLKTSKDTFSSKIEIILLDFSNKVDDEKVKEALEKYKNIIYVEAKGKSKSEGYNIGIKKATGNYISFIEKR